MDRLAANGPETRTTDLAAVVVPDLSTHVRLPCTDGAQIVG
jgi:hypothetical protein